MATQFDNYSISNGQSTATDNNGVDSLLFNNVGQFGNPRFVPVGNIQKGGQLGFGPRITQMDGATPLALNCAHVFVLQQPRMWDRFPKVQQTYKAMIELHAKSIDGIDIGYTEEFDDTQIGHDGQSASMPLQTKRNPVNPSVTVDDITGNLFWNLNYLWLKHINHPDTCASLLSALYGDAMEQWVWSTFTSSWLVIQPDPTGLSNRLVEAAVITNIVPTETGNLGMKRTIGATELAKRTVTYKGVITHNENTRELGRLVLNSINAHKPNLDYALTYNGISSNIIDYGAKGWVDEATNNGLVQEATNDFGITSDSTSTF
jgi:hypothetical protein